ncbi:MAG: hypothetical protein ACE141_19275, partial [Bryobacteraceae bacterium]
MARSSDIGPRVVDDLYRRMMIDAEWSVRNDRSFTWWGHNLAQRVWAEPVRRDAGVDVVCVRAETDFLRNVPDTERTAAALQALNSQASLSGFVWDKQRGRIKLACSAYCNEENVGWTTRLLYAAIAIQCADAHIKAEMGPQLLQSEVDVSQHPEHGPRSLRDDMLNVIQGTVAPHGSGRSAFTAEDFSEAARILSRQVLASSGKTGLTAEFPFCGSTPAVGKWLGLSERKGLETALLQVDGECRHPQLGSGMQMRLTLPIDCDRSRGQAIACKLNLAECVQWTRCNQLGGWCWDPSLHAPTFASFVP